MYTNTSLHAFLLHVSDSSCVCMCMCVSGGHLWVFVCMNYETMWYIRSHISDTCR